MSKPRVVDTTVNEMCAICGEPIDDVCGVSCIACGKRVHFRGADAPGPDCSRIVSQLDLCGLAFICEACCQDTTPQDAAKGKSSKR